MLSRSLPRLYGIPCWLFPILSGLTWLVTLLSILIEWVVKGSPHYPEMFPKQHLAYISNAGASTWGRPLFITGCVLTAVLFYFTFITERWLRYRGRLLHYTDRWTTASWIAAALITTVATISLILFPVFCVRSHAIVHYSTVAIFAVGNILAAALICVEKRQISRAFPSNLLLRRALQIKIFFIAIEILFVVLGSVTMYKRMYRTSVVVEWLAAFFFSFYMASFAADFMAVRRGELEKTGMVGLDKAWDGEVGLERPRRMHMFTRHKDYAELA